MDAREDIKFGDIVPVYGKPFGKGNVIRCMGMTYGVIIGFTKLKHYPRATPIYYKMIQKFDPGHSKDAYYWMLKSSFIMFNVVPIKKEDFLKESNRQINYDSIMSAALTGIAIKEALIKKNEKLKAHNDYFSF